MLWILVRPKIIHNLETALHEVLTLKAMIFGRLRGALEFLRGGTELEFEFKFNFNQIKEWITDCIS